MGSKTDEFVKSKNNTQQYLNDLQKKNSQINILSGSKNIACKRNDNAKTKKAHEQAKKEKQEEAEERIKIRREKFQEFSERLEKRSKGEMETAYINSILQQMKVDYMA